MQKRGNDILSLNKGLVSAMSMSVLAPEREVSIHSRTSVRAIEAKARMRSRDACSVSIGGRRGMYIFLRCPTPGPLVRPCNIDAQKRVSIMNGVRVS